MCEQLQHLVLQKTLALVSKYNIYPYRTVIVWWLTNISNNMDDNAILCLTPLFYYHVWTVSCNLYFFSKCVSSSLQIVQVAQHANTLRLHMGNSNITKTDDHWILPRLIFPSWLAVMETLYLVAGMFLKIKLLQWILYNLNCKSFHLTDLLPTSKPFTRNSFGSKVCLGL